MSGCWNDRYDDRTRPHHGREYRILSGLRRDTENGMVSGVCAGIAGYYGINRKFVRIAAVIGLLINPLLAFIVYGIATITLKPIERAEVEAATASATSSGRDEAPSSDLPPELRFAALREKFNDLIARTGNMESEVTSKEFNLRRDFRRMGEA